MPWYLPKSWRTFASFGPTVNRPVRPTTQRIPDAIPTMMRNGDPDAAPINSIKPPTTIPPRNRANIPSPGFGTIRTSRITCDGFVVTSQFSSIVGIP